MKNRLHTWLAVVAGVAVVSGALGGMQKVYASRVSKVEVSETQNAEMLAGSEINKKMPTVKLTIDKASEESAVKLGSSQGEAAGTGVLKEGSIAGIAYDKLVMANVMEAVNIRKEPSEQSEIVGKLYKECGGELLEKADGWTKLKSGAVTGYVKDDYLLFGAEAQALAASVVNVIATSETSCLRVRTEPSEDSTILGLLAEGDKIEVIEEQGEWVKSEYSDGTECYVAAQYVSISSELPYGESIEAIHKRESLEQKEAELIAQEAKSGAGDSKSTSAKKEASSAAGADTVNTAAVDPSAVDDVRLLAALIQCEAGNETYAGQVAIGDVVMNRLRTGRYGSSIYSVVYAKSQFGPAGSGMVAQVYAAGPKATCIAAASEAISGVSYIGTATSFRNVSSGHEGIVVGNHVFW